MQSVSKAFGGSRRAPDVMKLATGGSPCHKTSEVIPARQQLCWLRLSCRTWLACLTAWDPRCCRAALHTLALLTPMPTSCRYRHHACVYIPIAPDRAYTASSTVSMRCRGCCRHAYKATSCSEAVGLCSIHCMVKCHYAMCVFRSAASLLGERPRMHVSKAV